MKTSRRQLLEFTILQQLLLFVASIGIEAIIISLYLPTLDIPKTSAFFSSKVISSWTDFFLPGVYFVFKVFLAYFIINSIFLFFIQKIGERWKLSIPVGIVISIITHIFVFWASIFWVRMSLYFEAAAFRNADLGGCFGFKPLETPELLLGISFSILIIGVYWSLWKKGKQFSTR